jgi:hypothetical protein
VSATITIDKDGRTDAGPVRERRGKMNLGTYATGGVAVTAKNFKLYKLQALSVHPAAGIIFEFDKANLKVKAYRQKDPAAAGGADIALPEVANAVDLSAVSARFIARGQ